MKTSVSSDTLLKLVRFEVRQLSRNQRSSPQKSPPPEKALPPRRRARCWIRSGSELCQFNFESQLNCLDQQQKWQHRLNERRRVLNSSLRCKYSAPVELSKRRIMESEFWHSLVYGLHLPEPLKQQACPSPKAVSAPPQPLHSRKISSQNIRPNFPEQIQYQLPPGLDYKKTAFFRRMKQAMRKNRSAQGVNLQADMKPQTTLRSKLYNRQVSIAPWDASEENRADLLP